MNATSLIEEALINTPIGPLEVVWSDDGLHAVSFARSKNRRRAEARTRGTKSFERTVYGRALRRYFGGDLDALSGLPVVVDGTPFQRKVWRALREIPSGRTESYAELAARIGHPGAARAVGSANRNNPIGIVVPCHRVIAADKRIAGYAGGVDRKRWLLDHEGAEYRD